jgi:hypothetical protein
MLTYAAHPNEAPVMLFELVHMSCAHVNGVARLWASDLVLHRQTHLAQCIAHLLLTHRGLNRAPNEDRSTLFFQG